MFTQNWGDTWCPVMSWRMVHSDEVTQQIQRVNGCSFPHEWQTMIGIDCTNQGETSPVWCWPIHSHVYIPLTRNYWVLIMNKEVTNWQTRTQEGCKWLNQVHGRFNYLEFLRLMFISNILNRPSARAWCIVLHSWRAYTEWWWNRCQTWHLPPQQLSLWLLPLHTQQQQG